MESTLLTDALPSSLPNQFRTYVPPTFRPSRDELTSVDDPVLEGITQVRYLSHRTRELGQFEFGPMGNSESRDSLS